MISYLQIENLTKSFGDRILFENISLGIGEGDRIGLIAKNGAGKTTLLNILAGKENYDSGNIVFRNNLRVGYLEQSPSYPPELTVIQACFQSDNDTVRLIAEYEQALQTDDPIGLQELLDRMDHYKAWDYEQRAKQILSQLKINNFDQPVKELSGGQLKRLALANVLITEPDLLILDEPTNHLDIDGREALINALNEYNGSVILITHDIHLIELIADNLWLVKDGCCRPYDGDLADYRNLLLAKTEPEKKVKPKSEMPKVNVREERKSVGARLRRVEREMEKLNADRAAIEAAFQTPLTSEEIIRSQKELAWISAALGEYEEEWLELSERLEQLGQ